MSQYFVPVVVLVTTVLPVLSYDTVSYRVKLSDTSKRLLGYPEDNLLDFTHLAERYGYYSEKHEVTTEDGYILNLYRLNSKKCDDLIQPPVFLMHGLLLSSDTWLDSGPNSSLAYMLADHCYDLWVGNIRGNYNGRRHVALDPDKDKEFWNFCVDDNGYYDIPAQIDKILDVTHSQKLNYIGFSQGCAEVTIACTERPEYCDKVGLFIALAPALKMRNTRSVLFRATSQAIEALNGLLSKLGIYEVLFKGGVIQELLEYTCKKGLISVPICEAVLSAADSYDPGSIALRTWRRLCAHFPAGSSTKTFVKYAQSFKDEDFRKFDYGPKTNLKLYGTEEAPRFEVEKVTFPTVIVYGLNDYIVDLKDMYWMRDHLPNVLELKIVDRPLWNHFDIPYSSYSPTLLFPIVNEYLREYSSHYF